jgi:hypothetical protein
MKKLVLLVALAMVLSGCEVARYAAKCTTISQANCN